MTWQWKYEVGDIVRLNKNCKSGLPNMVGREGKIVSLLEGKLYDYEVEIEKNVEFVRVKENEIDIIEE